MRANSVVVSTLLLLAGPLHSGTLIWPLNCVPGSTCDAAIGYPDVDSDGKAFNCGSPGYLGHQGTDIRLNSWSQMDSGVNVYAAADGQVVFVFDGKYDRCPDATHPDCQEPPTPPVPGDRTGYRVCTDLGPYCGTGTGSCYWCFAGGNVVVIRHSGVPGVFATRYDHLKKGSIRVVPGRSVRQGDVIAQVGSAGHSTWPHLHFEVWGTGYYQLADPWAGPCGPNFSSSLWRYDPPYTTGGTPKLTGSLNSLRRTGTRVRGVVSCRNKGNAGSGGSTARVFVGANPTLARAKLVKTPGAPALDQGKSSAFRITVPAKRKSRYMILLLDALGQISESNETDNTITSAF